MQIRFRKQSALPFSSTFELLARYRVFQDFSRPNQPIKSALQNDLLLPIQFHYLKELLYLFLLFFRSQKQRLRDYFSSLKPLLPHHFLLLLIRPPIFYPLFPFFVPITSSFPAIGFLRSRL